MTYTNILENINYPHDLKNLNRTELKQLADELREYILHNVSKTGGHLASNLGSVELTVALHYVYDTPNDKLVWDVGHQSYPHKILTGRRNKMDTLRQTNGLAGFPKRDESEYDTFGVGHSSTSISAALGMVVGNRQRGKQDKVVAIIGDGSMTAGLAFEGLNNAGWLNTDMLVILNDNEMSISENVGAVSTYLSKILAGRFYNKVKDTANKALSVVPSMQKLAHKVEEHMKGMIMPSTMFEELGFNYIGPIDGHDLDQLIDTLNELKNLTGPQFLHIVTKKGQGYKLAENDPIGYHGVSTFNPNEGMQAKASAMTYTQVFGKFLCDIAKMDNEFLAITPAMREGSGMVEFAKEYPEKFFDVGIAEQHAITFAAGVATQGIKPIVAIYSTFLQRGYDQLIHDVALQNLSVLFAIDRAGIVGADGPTHNGAFDISFLRCIPNMIIMTPSDENECYQMLYTGFRLNAPVAVRYPRGSGIGKELETFNSQLMDVGKGRVLRSGKKIAFLAFGSMVYPALEAANEIDATVCDMRFVKPLDRNLISEMVAGHDYIVTVEENAIMAGAGSACVEAMLEMGIYKKQVITIGIPDQFIEHGDPKAMLGSIGLNKNGILDRLKQLQIL
ncbi:1-deoxy-D-xylulose-5-phosphate synthase [Aquella oligotrophica]|uniref:1-deoxy-D-xylulose-5-phosphate synthase n=1 Tax=Aquella oligotrophica TaxID=2067065 RepID=A0A2I7N406_9NEIS|nr:1-deoxy-D-xylulose-5-phosphate synthase [Aquella oligotrophica]AUR51158.1 1-deoxy-D-xylulose-5-phosphate synthase [Aquella oligotrophica]